MENPPIQTIDAYIATFPKEVADKLESFRQLIRHLVPEATEAIKYGMPTFVLKGNLVHFAAYKNHIGFYPTPSGVEHFKDEIKSYKSSKGAIQFPINEPLPMELIERIVLFRVGESKK